VLRRRSALGLLLLSAVTLAAPAPSSAAPLKPSVRVVPGKVAIRSRATVVATHLQPNALLTVLLAIPNLQKRRVEQFLGSTHADPRGNVRVTVKIPIVTKCGPATVYLVNAQTQQLWHAPFKLTGCTVSAGTEKAPPPPPAPHKP
jgi:hypothetical protein